MTPDTERKLYLDGIELFNAHEFFEAHEVWEDISVGRGGLLDALSGVEQRRQQSFGGLVEGGPGQERGDGARAGGGMAQARPVAALWRRDSPPAFRARRG